MKKNKLMTFISHTVSWLASHLCPWPLLNTLTVWQDGSLVWEEIWRLRHTHSHPPSPQQVNTHHGQTISVLSYISKKDYFLLSATGLKAAHQGSWKPIHFKHRIAASPPPPSPVSKEHSQCSARVVLWAAHKKCSSGPECALGSQNAVYTQIRCSVCVLCDPVFSGHCWLNFRKKQTAAAFFHLRFTCPVRKTAGSLTETVWYCRKLFTFLIYWE